MLVELETLERLSLLDCQDTDGISQLDHREEAQGYETVFYHTNLAKRVSRFRPAFLTPTRFTISNKSKRRPLKRSSIQSCRHPEAQLEGCTAHALTRHVLHALLAQVATNLPRPSLPLHAIPRVQALAQTFLLDPEFITHPLLLVAELSIVRFNLARDAGGERGHVGVELAAGDERR